MSSSGLESDSNGLSSSSDRDMSLDDRDDRYPVESDEEEQDDGTAVAKPPDGTTCSAVGSSVLAVDVLDLLDQV